MVLVHSFKETCLGVSGSDVDSQCLNVHVPLPADDHRGILPNFKRDPSSSWRTQSSNGASLDAEEIYDSDFVATAGGSFFREAAVSVASNQAQPRSIVWKVFKNSQLLELDPVDLNSASKPRYRKIRIHSPAKFHNNCITITEDKSTERIVIDFISESNYLYTISFSFSEFIVSSSRSLSDNGHSLREENSANWRSIKYPYSFDLKKPHLMYAISANELAVSTVDGGLVKMERQTPLSGITTYIFNDPSQASGLSRILPWGHKDQVPGKTGLSLRTAISIVAVSEARLLITLSISRVLRLWSLVTMDLIEEHELVSPQDSAHQDKILIGPSPMNLLSVPTWKRRYKAAKAIFLATYMPLSDGLFKIWQLNLDAPEAGQALVDLGADYELKPQIPDSFSPWFVNDFKIIEKKRALLLTIMWKSNTFSAMHQTLLPTSETQDTLWHVACETEEVDLQYTNSGNLQDDKTKYFLDKIFGPDGYAQETIETALPIYGSRFAVQLYNPDQVVEEGEISLQSRVCQTVGTAVSLGYTNDSVLDYAAYRTDLSREWARFDRLCSELQRRGDEVLSLGWDSVLDVFWVVKASFVSAIRPALPIELFYNNRSGSPDERISSIVASSLPQIQSDYTNRVLRLVDSLYNFRRNLSHIHFSEVVSCFIEDYSPKQNFGTAERMKLIFDNHIDGQVSEIAKSGLHNTLQEVEKVDELLEFLYAAICTNSLIESQHNQSYLTASGCIAISKALFEILSTSRLVVSDILLMLIATYHDDDVISEHAVLYTKFLSLLKAINSILDSMNILPATPSVVSLQSDDLPKTKLSFFQGIILSEREENFNAGIGENGFAPVLHQVWNYFNISAESSAACRFVVQLFVTRNLTEAHEMCNYLDINSFTSFIRAHLSLESGEGSKALALFRTSSVELAQRRLSVDELKVLRLLNFPSYTENSFGEGLSRFFIDASRTALFLGKKVRSLQLAKDAQVNLSWGITGGENEDPNLILELNLYVYSHLFESAIESCSYDDAYTSLVEIYMLNSFREDSEDEQPYNMQEMRIMPYIESLASAMTLTGNGSRLCQYPFIGLTSLVSQFFLEKAENSLIRGTLIFGNENIISQESKDEDVFLYYRALYAWNVEHSDFRGGKL